MPGHNSNLNLTGNLFIYRLINYVIDISKVNLNNKYIIWSLILFWVHEIIENWSLSVYGTVQCLPLNLIGWSITSFTSVEDMSRSVHRLKNTQYSIAGQQKETEAAAATGELCK